MSGGSLRYYNIGFKGKKVKKYIVIFCNDMALTIWMKAI